MRTPGAFGTRPLLWYAHGMGSYRLAQTMVRGPRASLPSSAVKFTMISACPLVIFSSGLVRMLASFSGRDFPSTVTLCPAMKSADQAVDSASEKTPSPFVSSSAMIFGAMSMPGMSVTSTPTCEGNTSTSEGNVGTTSLTLTVSLTAPAGPGGVTFDIATADSTATVANNDYVARSLSAQTIPAGSIWTRLTGLPRQPNWTSTCARWKTD